jgi:hypothetical protein
MGFFMLARLAKKAFKAVSGMNSGITNGASGGFSFLGFFFTGVSTTESSKGNFANDGSFDGSLWLVLWLG